MILLQCLQCGKVGVLEPRVTHAGTKGRRNLGRNIFISLRATQFSACLVVLIKQDVCFAGSTWGGVLRTGDEER